MSYLSDKLRSAVETIDEEISYRELDHSMYKLEIQAYPRGEYIYKIIETNSGDVIASGVCSDTFLTHAIIAIADKLNK